MTLVQKCQLPIQKGPLIQVEVANGDVLVSEGSITIVSLWLQGTKFNANFFTLPLGGCDVVLGIQWLLTLGPVLWDFSQLIMSFTFKAKFV